jgi:Spx/MgsR family transcriptional regulator
MIAMRMYGITNCDTIKSARAWLSERGIAYRFVDFRKTPPLREQLAGWCAEAGWQTLLNRRGTTWKKLAPEKQATVTDASAAIAVMLENPTAIRRPVMETDAGLLIGFDRETWEQAFPGS